MAAFARQPRGSGYVLHVTFIFTIIGAMLVLDAICWWLLARLTHFQLGRILLGIFMAAQMITLICLIGSRIFQTGWDRWLPKFAVSALFIWHFIGLGLLSIIGVAMIPILLVSKIVPRRHVDSHQSNATHSWSRRDFFRIAASVMRGAC